MSLIIIVIIHGAGYDFHSYCIPWYREQILLLRDAKALLKVLKMYPRYVMVPHRLMPYPEIVSVVYTTAAHDYLYRVSFSDSSIFVLSYSWHMQIVKKVIHRAPVHTDDNNYGWSQMSCCLERQNCLGKRINWRPVKDSNVSLVMNDVILNL